MDIPELIEKGKIQRYLSARNKIIYPGGIYHVIHRAPGKELIFLEKNDYLYMLSLLKEVSKKFLWNIFSFVFMSNHFHILLKITDANLSGGIKNLCERYAKFFNIKYERKGPVFARPYRTALCLDDVYLISISVYMHLNPFKAGICKNINDYRWSSLRLYIKETGQSFVNPKFVLAILDQDICKARQKYLKLITKSSGIEFNNVIEAPSSIEYFREKLSDFLKEMGIYKKDDLEKEINVFKKKARVRKPEDILAKKYLIEQLLARGYRINEIAKKLNVTRAAIYHILKYTKRATLKMYN